MIRDLTDDEARRSLVLKWGVADPDVVPAWIAEMDYAVAEPITAALHRAIDDSRLGYPPFGYGGELGRAYAGFAGRHFGHEVDPDLVLPVVDVTAGVRLALDVLSDPAPMVMPVPAYSPQLEIAQITGRARVDLVVEPDADRAGIDLDRLDTLLTKGARTHVP